MTGPTTLPFGAEAIARAATLIVDGQVVAVPTETVYGLAADATRAEAVARIYAAKGRPSFNPLIVHVPNLAAARSRQAALLAQWQQPQTQAADPAEARARADAALTQPAPDDLTGEAAYWDAASRAEALFLMGALDAAATSLAKKVFGAL